jgi:hypothetical protein
MPDPTYEDMEAIDPAMMKVAKRHFKIAFFTGPLALLLMLLDHWTLGLVLACVFIGCLFSAAGKVARLGQEWRRRQDAKDRWWE